MKYREELIKRIKECGQSLIDNAEDLVSNVNYLTDVYITCYMSDMQSAPTISINNTFIPEGFAERKC